MEKALASKKLLIKGRVQAVFYRAWLKKNAENAKITGWVKNLSDGSVEAVLQGDKEKVDNLIKKCRQGPPLARVDEIIIKKARLDKSLKSFRVKS